MTSTSKIRVLAVFANPPGTNRLRLDIEERVIREAIKMSRKPDNILLTTCPAATIRDLSWTLLNDTFEVIHIAGHGSGNGLILSNEQGGRFLVDQPTLAELFLEYRSSIRCVILNACYSFTQGCLISEVVPFTIAMEHELNDNAAIKFSEGFYDALAAKKSIELAFREGTRRVKFHMPGTAALPQLLKQGEIPTPANVNMRPGSPAGILELPELEKSCAIVGVALDFSGSMKKSIHNKAGEHTERLNSVRQALSDLSKTVSRGIRENQNKDAHSLVEMFVYGFGLRTIGTCDLLSLIKACRQVITSQIIEETQREYQQEKQAAYQGYAGLGSFMRRLGLDSAVDRFRDIAEIQACIAIRKRIWHKMQGAVESRLIELGDTTLSIDEILELWGENTDILYNSEGLLFGETPIKEALMNIIGRFERELQTRNKNTQPLLFLISDGKYPNVDPLPLAHRLRAMGVTVVSCLITDMDIANPRELLHASQPAWEIGAKVMFDMASPLGEGTALERFLLHKGWTIYPQPKLFVQVNHSDVLKEFICIALSQFEDADRPLSLPDGW